MRFASTLIGTPRWDPSGESMVTVLEKLAILNDFSAGDLARMVGVKGANTFGSLTRCDASDPSTIRTGRLCKLAGWKPTVLESSFPAAYRPAPSDAPVPDWRFFDVASSMRLCMQCSEQGVHLVLHQFSEIAGCPIHLTPLIDACPRCRAPLSRHAYPPDCHHTSFSCSSPTCGWCPWAYKLPSPQPELQQRKRQVLDEYGRWQKAILDRRQVSASPVLIGTPRRWGEVATLAALVPGPDWIATCVPASVRVRVSEREVPARKLDATALSSADPRVGGEGLERKAHDDRMVELLSRRRTRVGTMALERYRRLRDEFDIGSSLSGVRSTRFQTSVSFTESVSVAATALDLWVRCAWPQLGLVAPNAGPDPDSRRVVSRSFWQHWLEGPARLYPLEPRDSTPGLNALVERIDASWSEQMLNSLYVAMIGRAVSLPNMGFADRDLLDLACDTGSLPLSEVIWDEGAITVRTATQVAAPDRFVTLFRGGYTGIVASDDGIRLDGAPVAELVGLRTDEHLRTARRLVRAYRPASGGSKVDERTSLDLAVTARRTITARRTPVAGKREPARTKPSGGLPQENGRVHPFDRSAVETSEVPTALVAIARHAEVIVQRRDGSSWYVHCAGILWVIWPTSGCWAGTDGSDTPVGPRFCGPIAAFKLACIDNPGGLPPNHNRVWNIHDRNRLMSCIEANDTVDEAAYVLGRTVWSVVAKVGALHGLSFDPLRGDDHLGDHRFSELMRKGS